MHKSSFHFTDPIQHKNLTIQFLISASVPPDYLTLAEGCRLNLVEILETGVVGRLSVHNRSPKKPLFIQLGELLKGGLQDRTIATDLVLDPGEQYDGLSVHCVEQARWSKRHEEDHKKFVSTQDFVATKPLRSTLERREDQQSVWAAVASAKVNQIVTDAPDRSTTRTIHYFDDDDACDAGECGGRRSLQSAVFDGAALVYQARATGVGDDSTAVTAGGC